MKCLSLTSKNLGLASKPERLSLNGIATAVLAVLLVVFGQAIAYYTASAFLVATGIKLQLIEVVMLLKNMPYYGLAPQLIGGSILTVIILRSRLKPDMSRIMRQLLKVSTVSLVLLMVFGFAVTFAPVVRADAVATSNYYLQTPLPIASAYVGQYSNSSYFYISGATWQNMEVNANLAQVESDAMASVTSGTVYLGGVRFLYNLTIPSGVTVHESCGGGYPDRYFVQTSQVGSPFTISIDKTTQSPIYYICQDSAGNYINSFTSTDAASLIQSAINACGTTGGTISVQSGTYLLNYESNATAAERDCIIINNKSNITIAGESGTVFRLANNQNATMICIFSSSTHNRITGITFDGNQANNLGVASGQQDPNGVNIELDSMFNTVDHCYFTNMQSHPVLIITTSNQNLVCDNTFYDNNWFDIAATGGSEGNVFQNNLVNSSIGMESYLSSNTVFAGNSFYNTPRAGAVSDATSTIHLYGQSTVYGNYIYNSSRSGIILSPDNQPEQVYGNTIINPCFSQTAGDAGILMSTCSNKDVYGNTVIGSLLYGIYIYAANGCTILNNIVANSAKLGILTYAGASNNIISNNRIYNNTNYDVQICSGTVGNSVSNNDFSYSTTPTAVILDQGTDTSIQGNLIANVPEIGISLYGTDTIVKNNNLYNVATSVSFPSAAIYIPTSSATQITILGNTLLNSGTGPCGIDIRSGGNLIDSNYVTGFTSYGIFDYSQANNRISNNRAAIEMYSGTTNCICVYNTVTSLTDLGTNDTLIGNTGYNPIGYIADPISSSGSSIVDSGSSSTWTSGTIYTDWQSPKTLYISGGTVTAITVNGQVIDLTSGSIVLQPSDTFSMTFSSAPTVKVMGQ